MESIQALWWIPQWRKPPVLSSDSSICRFILCLFWVPWWSYSSYRCWVCFWQVFQSEHSFPERDPLQPVDNAHISPTQNGVLSWCRPACPSCQPSIHELEGAVAVYLQASFKVHLPTVNLSSGKCRILLIFMLWVLKTVSDTIET